MGEYVYRYEIDLAEIADEYAKRLQERVDGMALDKAADTLERFGYVKVIRCHDCKHYDRMNDDEGMCMVPDDNGDYARWMVDDVGYCYLGERRQP